MLTLKFLVLLLLLILPSEKNVMQITLDHCTLSYGVFHNYLAFVFILLFSYRLVPFLQTISCFPLQNSLRMTPEESICEW
uniref:Uncharacterized protein n=1 Tax=Oryza brachyantha TaxID=4533 RepID=J3LA74_ORYBR